MDTDGQTGPYGFVLSEVDQEVAAMRFMQKHTFIHISPPSDEDGRGRRSSSCPASSRSESLSCASDQTRTSGQCTRTKLPQQGGPRGSANFYCSDDVVVFEACDFDSGGGDGTDRSFLKRAPKKKRQRFHRFLDYAKGLLDDEPSMLPAMIQFPHFIARDRRVREKALQELRAHVWSMGRAAADGGTASRDAANQDLEAELAMPEEKLAAIRRPPSASQVLKAAGLVL